MPAQLRAISSRIQDKMLTHISEKTVNPLKLKAQRVVSMRRQKYRTTTDRFASTRGAAPTHYLMILLTTAEKSLSTFFDVNALTEKYQVAGVKLEIM